MGEHVARAKTLARESKTNPDTVDVEAVLDLLRNPSVSPTARNQSLEALQHLAEAGVPIDCAVISILEELLEHDQQPPAPVLECIGAIAIAHPEEVTRLSDNVVDYLSTDIDSETIAATNCVVELAMIDPSALMGEVPMLAALLDAEHQTVHENAVFALSKIAHANPQRVVPVVSQLVTEIDSRSRAYRADALSALGAVAAKHPESLEPVLDTVADIAQSNDPVVTGNAIGVLGDAARANPELVNEHLGVVRASLSSPDKHVRANATATIVTIAARDPSLVRGFIPDIIEVLDDPSPVVRQNACSMIGHVGATIAIPHLKTRKQRDPAASVQKTAAWALDQL